MRGTIFMAGRDEPCCFIILMDINVEGSDTIMTIG